MRARSANGDGPRDHEALRHLNFPPLGQGGRAAPLVTKTLVFLGEGSLVDLSQAPGSGGKMFRAFDKATGEVVWVTYLADGKQYIVLTLGWDDTVSEDVALGLP